MRNDVKLAHIETIKSQVGNVIKEIEKYQYGLKNFGSGEFQRLESMRLLANRLYHKTKELHKWNNKE